ncbi:MAG TPA: translocation/assembly module TamB domain-containing protein [Flavisolibacter sp.]|jgi:hypothetical protein|nr:translocation/assembly module TamB domain-containing protein [Flavisolibacter sp.]
MQTENKHNHLPRKIARIFLKTVLFLLLFIVLIFLLILTPPVQRFLTGKVETYLQNKLKTRVEIGSISFGLSGNVNLQNIYIEDKTKDTLLSGGALKAHINFMKLFSNEVEVKDIELQNITAKIKRVLPDTVFNFQFIVDAFVTKSVNTDTTSAPMKLNISDISLDNVNLKFNDVITGNDIFAHIGNLSATIDTLDPYKPHIDMPSLIVRNVQARVRQSKPLITPEPLSKDLADASVPTTMQFGFGTIDISKLSVDYGNDVSAFYTTLNLGTFKAKGKQIDLAHNKIYLDQVELANSTSIVRLGKKEAAKVVVKEVNQEIEAQKTAGWDFRIDKLLVDNNTIQFDNDNDPRLAYGMDYSHINAKELTLHVEDFVMNTDTVAARVTEGHMKEKSGFVLNELHGDLLYANKQSYLKDLYIKTPGSEIKRSAVLEYASLDELQKNFPATVLDIEVVDSKLQVKDILTFAPQLRSNPALSNPNDIWDLNLVANGTLNNLTVEDLRFNGLRNTQLNARGTLTGLMDPAKAGGHFTINRFHTSQSDLALFTGQRLSNAQMNLPETFDLTGTIDGNAGAFNTNLSLNSSAGFVGLNGRFSNVMNPAATTYNATVRTNNLQLGSILRQPDQIGSLSGNFTITGKGITPATINTSLKGVITSVGYNHYQYRNIRLNGSLRQTAFTATADINDPNIDLNLTARGNLTDNPTFQVNGMIDSVKTLPLHFTTQPLVFRGQIDGRVNNANPDLLDANILITRALFVSGENRLPLDTVQLVSGRNDTASFIRFNSDIANANITGNYKITELGTIIQNTIQPYFSVTPAGQSVTVQPYDFRFTADVVYSPILASFVPGLTAMDPIHAEGRFATGMGMNALVTSSHLAMGTNDISGVNIRANTSDSGLVIAGNVGHIKSGSSFDIFNTRLNATALNNTINFNMGIDDQNSRNKYYLSGVVNQPTAGTYAIRLKPDSLLLNYDSWTVTTDNLLTISPQNVTANNFVLSRNGQRLSINSIDGNGMPLQVAFTDFRLATITGFVKSDSLLVDGVMNGNVTFQNIMQQPVFTSNLTINDLSMRQDTIGNINMQVSTGDNNRYNTNVTISGKGNDIALTGYFAPAGKDIDLNLDLAVRTLQLKSLEGAMASAIDNASGTINGGVRIRGSSSKPSIQGDLNFNKASFALTMLGSQFTVDNEKLSVTENGLQFNNFTIRDSANNALNINGDIATTNFINYKFNMGIRATNFQVLNSTKAQNKLYYGEMNISTNLRITGDETRPVVDGTLTVNDGTSLSVVIPQREPGVVEREGVIEFVDMDSPENDSLFLAYDSLNTSNVLGMDVAVNIEVKKEAILNVIVDEANGDFLNVQGEALISAGVDPSGKITMVGNYTIDQGAYQLSFNFLQRRFDIQKGSTITWTGEPTSAQLNVTAVYVANTAPLDLVQDQVEGSTPAIRNTYLQKLPFQVHLNLTGELMKPVVGFDIMLPENQNYGVSNDIVTLVQSRLNQLREDEGEINKQVFSLLLLGRFVGENPFESSGGGFSAGSYARQSVSRLLTEQLNSLASGLIQGVDINFDVVSSDDYTTGSRRNRTDLNVGISKRLLNDRLKVTVGSNFGLEGPSNSNQQSNNIAGNVAVDYQLTKDGRYLLRFFRRNEYEGVVDGYIIENGLSFILSVDYNRFRELLHRRKQRITTNSSTQNP